jgi:hypothetical protein
MPSERSNIKYPMWRKKVDGSMFYDRCTVIPDWVKDNLFEIRDTFPHPEKSNPKSKVTITLIHENRKKTSHWGSVITSHRGKLPPVMRLFYDEDVVDWLEKKYVLTSRRNQIRRKLDWNGPTAEKKIPFWEFIDIEYNSQDCEFIFTAHYNLTDYDNPLQVFL